MKSFAAVFVAFCAIYLCAEAGLLPVEAYRTLWSYNDTHSSIGPSNWHDNFKYCAGDGKVPQSPTNIVSKDAAHSTGGVLPLLFGNFSVLPNYYARNVGASISITPDETEHELGFFNAAGNFFLLAEVHFHWHDDDDEQGSEHAIDGVRTALEAHLVHYEMGFKDLAEAAHAMNGSVAVIAVRFSTDPEKHKSPSAVTSVLHVIEHADELPYMSANISIPIEAWDAYGMVEEAAKYGGMYHYNGSLTTPPCYPGVQWFVAAKDVYLPSDAMDYFRKLHRLSEEDAKNASNPFCDVTNVRPLQEPPKSSYRTIFWKEGNNENGGEILSPVIIAVIVVCGLAAIVLIAVISYCLCCKSKKSKDLNQESPLLG